MSITTTQMLELPRAALKAGMELVDLLICSGLAASPSDARHMIRRHQARMNGRVIAHEGEVANENDLDTDGRLDLSAGDGRRAMILAL